MTALQFWLLMGALYAMGTIWWTVILRRLGKELPRSIKWGWFLGALAIAFSTLRDILHALS